MIGSRFIGPVLGIAPDRRGYGVVYPSLFDRAHESDTIVEMEEFPLSVFFDVVDNIFAHAEILSTFLAPDHRYKSM